MQSSGDDSGCDFWVVQYIDEVFVVENVPFRLEKQLQYLALNRNQLRFVGIDPRKSSQYKKISSS